MNDLLTEADGPIETLDQGRALLEQIKDESGAALQKMQGLSGAQWQELSDYRYKLVNARRSVQSKMQKLVMQRRKSRGVML